MAEIARQTVRGSKNTTSLWAVNGTLWQLANANAPALAQRNMATGQITRTLAIPQAPIGVAFGFGSIWLLEPAVVLSGPKAGTTAGKLVRVDQVSGRRVATIPLTGDVSGGTVAVGNGAVVVLETDGTIVRVDPLRNRVTDRYHSGAVETTTLIPLDGYDWICECIVNKLLRVDPRTHHSATFTIPEQAYLVGVDAADDARTLWLLDPTGGTLTSMNPRTGKTGPPLALGGDPHEAVIADGAVWAAAGRVVDRVDLQTNRRTTVALPAGVNATTIAADPATNSIWVGTSPA